MKIRLLTNRKLIVFGVFVCTLFLSTFTLAQSTSRRYPLVFHGNGARMASIRTCYNRARSAVSGFKTAWLCFVVKHLRRSAQSICHRIN